MNLPQHVIDSGREASIILEDIEHIQARLTALTSFIDSTLFDTLPKAEQGRLQRQKLIMIDYVAVLNERIAAW